MKQFRLWLLVFIWCGVIFYFSHQPELRSDLPPQWDFMLRKIAHITEYAILTFLLFRAFLGQKVETKKALAISAILAVLYAVSDEYHQTFIFGREGTARDVFIDSVGVGLVCWWKGRRVIK